MSVIRKEKVNTPFGDYNSIVVSPKSNNNESVIKNNGDADSYRRNNNDIDYEIYGSGIISSYDETNNIIQCAKGESKRSKFLPFDIEEIIMTRYDFSNIQERYYVIDSMEDLYETYYDNKSLFFYEG